MRIRRVWALGASTSLVAAGLTFAPSPASAAPPLPPLGPGVVTTATLTAPTSVTVGAGRVKLTGPNALPLSVLSEKKSGVSATPLRGVPLRGIPLRGIPLRGIPLRGVPLRGIPLRGIPLRGINLSAVGLDATPLRGVPLRGIPLSQLPLLKGLTWDEVLAGAKRTDGSDLTQVPLQNVTLGEAVDSLAAAGREVSLQDIDIAESPLRGVPLEGWLMANTPASAVVYPGGSLCDLFDSSTDVSPSPDTPCQTVQNLIGTPPTVLDLALAGAPVDQIPWHKVSLAQIPAGTADAPQFLRLIELGGDGANVKTSPLGQLKVSDLPTSTRARFAPADLAKRLSELLALPPLTIGDLASPDPAVVAPGADPLVSVADVFAAIVDPEAADWESADLSEVALGMYDTTSTPGLWTMSVTTDSAAGERVPVTLRLTLPDGYTPTPASLELAGALPGVESVEVAGPRVTIEAVTKDTKPFSVVISAFSPTDLRPTGQQSTFVAEPFGGPAVTAAKPLTKVVSRSAVERATPLSSAGSQMVFDHLPPGATQPRYYKLPAPAEGVRVTLLLGHLQSDNDLMVYGPFTDDGTAVARSPMDPLQSVGAASRPETAELITEPPAEAGLIRNQAFSAGLAKAPIARCLGVGIDLLGIPCTAPEAPIVAASIQSGLSTEEAGWVSEGSGYYIIQVSPKSGDGSPKAFSLRTKMDEPVDEPICPSDGIDGYVSKGTYSSTEAGQASEALAVIDRAALEVRYGIAQSEKVWTALTSFRYKGQPLRLLVADQMKELGTLRNDWHAQPCSVRKANTYVDALAAAIRGAGPNIKNVILIGSDEMLPMGRVRDLSWTANEASFADEVEGVDANPISAAARRGFVLSDSPYGVLADVSKVGGQKMMLPERAVGRLVEEPAEIIGQLEEFTKAGGVLDPTKGGVTEGLVAHWTFDETGGSTASDSVGGFNGVLNGYTLATPSWTSAGKVGGALRFNTTGVGSYVRMAGYPNLPSAYTVSAWVNYSSLGSAWQTIAKNWGSSGSSLGPLHFGLDSNGTSLSNYIKGASTASGTIPGLTTGTWYHVVVTVGGGFQKLYVNGNQVASVAFSGPPPAKVIGGALGVGVKLADDGVSVSPIAPGWFRGTMDDLAMWNRALSAAEVSAVASSAGGVATAQVPGSGKSNVVFGYDFLSDGSREISDWLSRVAPSAPAPYISETWGKAELEKGLFNPTAPPASITSLNAHFDPRRLLSADQKIQDTSLFPAGATYGGRLLFSMGCHAGLNIPAAYAGSSTGSTVGLGKDWTQELAARGAIWVANTGYGYGDTDVVAYSERLMSAFAENLGRTTSVGQALALAKQQYQSLLPAFSPVDMKVLNQTTLYGLPMWSTGARPQGVQRQAVVPEVVAGVMKSTFTIDTASQQDAVVEVQSPRGSYLANQAAGAAATPGYPLTPFAQRDLTPGPVTATAAQVPAGTRLHGVYITNLVSADAPAPVDPVISRAVVDSAAAEGEPPVPQGVWPPTIPSVRWLSAMTSPDGTIPPSLTSVDRTLLAQTVHFPNGLGTMDRATFTSITGEAVYSPSAVVEQPNLEGVQRVDGTIRVVVEKPGCGTNKLAVPPRDPLVPPVFLSKVQAAAAALPHCQISRSSAIFWDEATGQWTPLNLVRNATDGRIWEGDSPALAASAYVYVQAQDGVGNVAATWAGFDDLSSRILGSSVSGSLVPGSVDTYSGPVQIRANLPGGAQFANGDPSNVVEADVLDDGTSSLTVATPGLNKIFLVNDSGAVQQMISFTIDTAAPKAPTPVGAENLPLQGSTLKVTSAGSQGAKVTFPSSAPDGAGATVPLTCLPASGTTFKPGYPSITSVGCQARDKAGNRFFRSFKVQVELPPAAEDITGPRVTFGSAPGGVTRVAGVAASWRVVDPTVRDRFTSGLASWSVSTAVTAGTVSSPPASWTPTGTSSMATGSLSRTLLPGRKLWVRVIAKDKAGKVTTAYWTKRRA